MLLNHDNEEIIKVKINLEGKLKNILGLYRILLNSVLIIEMVPITFSSFLME